MSSNSNFDTGVKKVSSLSDSFTLWSLLEHDTIRGKSQYLRKTKEDKSNWFSRNARTFEDWVELQRQRGKLNTPYVQKIIKLYLEHKDENPKLDQLNHGFNKGKRKRRKKEEEVIKREKTEEELIEEAISKYPPECREEVRQYIIRSKEWVLKAKVKRFVWYGFGIKKVDEEDFEEYDEDPYAPFIQVCRDVYEIRMKGLSTCTDYKVYVEEGGVGPFGGYEPPLLGDVELRWYVRQDGKLSFDDEEVKRELGCYNEKD